MIKNIKLQIDNDEFQNISISDRDLFRYQIADNGPDVFRIDSIRRGISTIETVAIGGANLAALARDLGIEDLIAQNVQTATTISPNLLPQNSETQRNQITNNLSVLLLANIGNNRNEYIPVRYLTLYPYDNIPGWAEVGTVCSFTNNYSTEGQITKTHGFGNAVYTGAELLARESGLAVVGTTTGVAALQASRRAGFSIIPRNLLIDLKGRENVLNDICSPCSSEKTFDSNPANINAECLRCADVFIHMLKTNPNGLSAFIAKIRSEAPEVAERILKLCFFHCFVPLEHEDYEIFSQMNKDPQYNVPRDIIDQFIVLANDNKDNLL